MQNLLAKGSYGEMTEELLTFEVKRAKS